MRDFIGRKIKAGDYMLQSFNLGRCAAMKFCHVVKVSDTNIRAIGCRFYSGDEPHASAGYGVYNIKHGDRSYIVDKVDVPIEVLDELERVHGDILCKQ